MMISDLPEDLEMDILARVPTKTLATLQTTCKRWFNLFKDPNFVKKNQGKSAREVILLSRYGVHSVSVSYHGVRSGTDPTIEFRGKHYTPEDTKDLKISKNFHSDGLILCVTKECKRIYVWNPCTGKTRWIKPKSRYLGCDKYALGYEKSNTSCHNYKILRVCRYYKDKEKTIWVAEYEIYDFSSDSWRVLEEGFPDDWDVVNSGVSLKQNAYWIAFDKETGFFLLDFDFTTERFARLPLPYLSQNWDEDDAALSVVKDERLSVLNTHFATFPLVVKIWVSNKFVDTKDMSWSNFLVVDFGKFPWLRSVSTVMSFLLDEENKVAVCCHTDPDSRTIIYIAGEDIHREAYRETTEGTVEGTLPNWPRLVSYVPSLVHIG